jgi:hypothetical protein
MNAPVTAMANTPAGIACRVASCLVSCVMQRRLRRLSCMMQPCIV